MVEPRGDLERPRGVRRGGGVESVAREHPVSGLVVHESEDVDVARPGGLGLFAEHGIEGLDSEREEAAQGACQSSSA